MTGRGRVAASPALSMTSRARPADRCRERRAGADRVERVTGHVGDEELGHPGLRERGRELASAPARESLPYQIHGADVEA